MTQPAQNPAAVPDQAQPRIAARARLQDDKISGKPVLVLPENVIQLNETGTEILRLCDGQRTFVAIVAQLAAQYNAPAEHIAIGAAAFLSRMHALRAVLWDEPG